jgi:hypothetical protein
MTDFSKTNIHCSSIGHIMGTGKGKTNMQKWEYSYAKQIELESKYKQMEDRLKDMKSGQKLQQSITDWKAKTEILELVKNDTPLSTTAKSHLKKLYGYQKYGKWCAASDRGTKYTNKGTIAENDSLALLSKVKGVNLVKNEERVNNDFLTGIPDAFIGETIQKAGYIIDVKTSWDIETFLINLGRPLYSLYWWQIQGYLAITGAEVGEVAYCLVNTPQSLINNEVYKLKDRMDVVTDQDPAFLLKEKELINNLMFDDIPESDRVIRFLVERDDEAIQKVYDRVSKCREYLAEVEELHKEGIFLAKEPDQTEEIEENNQDSE